MDLIIRLQVYIVSICVLLIIYIQQKEEKQSYSLHNRLFRYLVLSTMMTLVLEAMSWSANGQSGTTGHIVNIGVNTLLFAINTVPLTMWTLYIISTANQDKEPVMRGLMGLGIPVTINLLMALSAPINQKYFYVDANNLYHRGEWTIIGNAIHVILIGANILVIIYNWEKINQRNRVPILLVTIPPIMGFIMQNMYYGTSLIWPGAMISILLSYIMIQSQVAKTDYLTGLYNRRELDFYIDRQIRSLPMSKRFAGVMIDLDDFKVINDQYGHAVGDRAIKTAASLITKSFRREDFVARYGGDEFIVILNVKDEKDLDNKVDHLKSQFELFNKKDEEKFKLYISVGYDIYSNEDDQGDEFLCQIDQLMYENKKERKARKSR